MFQVEREIESQLEKFEQLTGRIPVSVDGHQHVHVIPGKMYVWSGLWIGASVAQS